MCESCIANEIAGIGVSMAEKEVIDLKKYWGEIDYDERREALESAQRWTNIKPEAQPHLPDRLKMRINVVTREIKQLTALNEKEKPSIIASKLGLVKGYGPKHDYRARIRILKNMRNDELLPLGKYLGIHNIEHYRDQKDELYKIIQKRVTNGSRSLFYAYRSYIGRMTKSVE
jgi:hypothetical protein